jgi:hypothetical protein
VAIGHVNGDGRNDVVTLGSGSTGADLFLQAPSGRLPPRANQSLVTGVRALAIAIGDLNADGRNDVAIASSDMADTRVRVYLQDQTGRLPSDVSLLLEAGRSSGGVAIGDVNHDGKLDVAVGSAGPEEYGITMFYARETLGPGETPSATLATAVVPTWLDASDFNGDGLCDLAVAGSSRSPAFVIHYQRWPGGFAPEDFMALEAEVAPNSVAVGDLNGDGRKDLAFTAINYAAVFCYVQEPSGEMPSRPNLRLETGSLSGQRGLCAVGDLDGDGTDDVIANTFQGILYLFHQRPGRGLPLKPSGFWILRNFAGPYSAAIGDASGDGRNDLVITSFETNETSVYLAR